MVTKIRPETKEAKTIKALYRYGKEATLDEVAKLINSTKNKTKCYLSLLYRRGLILRRREYWWENGVGLRNRSYYKINPKQMRRVLWWIEHF